MNPDYRCFFCFTRAFERILEKENISIEAKNNFTYEMISLFQNNRNSFNTPEFSRVLHLLLKSYSLNGDPYKADKQKYNDLALSLVPEIKKIIMDSDDPFKVSLKASIAGNIIDFAANEKFDLQATLAKALQSELAIDYSGQLKKEIRRSDTILYLGDNAGEIVFDKLFIETLQHPNIVYVVRGAPIINDITIEDAEYVKMGEVAKVISSEYDAPSTIPHKSGKLFREYFEKADLIISKGQGNLEGLFHLNDKRIFFLLMAKCDVIADLLTVQKNSFVVFNKTF